MMNGKVIFSFILGAAAGSAVSWYLLRKKYEQIAQEEIDSVKEAFSKERPVHEPVENDDSGEEEYPTEPLTDEDVIVYEETVEELGYNGHTNYSSISSKKGGTAMKEREKPIVISPEEFGEIDEYESETLTYYADGVLTDDADNIISDINGLVGSDFADHFGDFEDDAVHIRNHWLSTDYEILRDTRNYSDVVPGQDDD